MLDGKVPDDTRPGDHAGAALPREFFDGHAPEVAPRLLGCVLRRDSPQGPVAAVITEVEAYAGLTDPASHAYRGETARNAVMFGPPGHAYVYRSYGIHWCLNFVCEPAGSASAVLIRALEPTSGIGRMRQRRGTDVERLLCAGPGRVGEALGVTHAHNGLALDQPPFEMWPRTQALETVVGERIGISKAADKPWRYGLKGSRFLSKPFRPPA